MREPAAQGLLFASLAVGGIAEMTLVVLFGELLHATLVGGNSLQASALANARVAALGTLYYAVFVLPLAFVAYLVVGVFLSILRLVMRSRSVSRSTQRVTLILVGSSLAISLSLVLSTVWLVFLPPAYLIPLTFVVGASWGWLASGGVSTFSMRRTFFVALSAFQPAILWVGMFEAVAGGFLRTEWLLSVAAISRILRG